MLKKIKDLLKKLGVHKVYAFFKRFFYECFIPCLLIFKVQLYFFLKQHGAFQILKRSNLNADLIISLTSYPPRFKTLHLTLKSLLLQNQAYDKLILWIAEKDKELLPEDVLELQKFGLTISFCEDIRSYKKIIPALEQFPEAYIVTVDDDTYYWRSWLAELLESHRIGTKEIVGFRGHLMKLANNGSPLPYSDWDYEGAVSEPSKFNFLTGVGGVLYPPNVLHADVKNQSLFMKLCPQADDIWLYWMARINDTAIKRVQASPRYFYFWPSTLITGLASTNVFNNGNDIQIDRLNQHYKIF